MADIELGAYLTEIEQLLAAEKNDEAVAHCRHVLDYFPKNLAVYRFLGKGLLEQRRFSDAADILYRVLSAAPDDFVAHVGLAIIGEEQGSLSQAVGHMARACDAQPNNAAIQGELKRLYGRRDGVEPARIRLTKGALGRLLLNGGNYTQAVDELRVALKEEPDRLDLQVLLAQAQWKDEQRIDAVEVCQAVLEELPFCLDANSILYEIWQSAGRDDEATTYWRRVEALDPYRAHEILQDQEEAAGPILKIPRLDYVPPTPDEVMGVPDWVHDLGLSFDDEFSVTTAKMAADLPKEPPPARDEPPRVTSEMPDVGLEAVPDWLRDVGVSDDVPPLGTEEDFEWREGVEGTGGDAPRGLEEAVPDWLRDAGLLGEAEEMVAPVIEFDAPAEKDTPQSTPREQAGEGELPDWLSDAVEWEGEEQAPSAAVGEPATEGDWLAELGQRAGEEVSDSGVPQLPFAPAAEEESPELDELTSLPDLDWEEVADTLGAAEVSGDEPVAPLAEGGEFPFDWAQDVAPAPTDEDATLSENTGQDFTSTETEELVMAQKDNDLDFPGDVGDLGDMPSDPDDALAWLEQLAAQQGAPLSELPSLQGDEDWSPDDVPDWLKEMAPPAAGSPQEQDLQPTRPMESIDELLDGSEDIPDWLKALDAEAAEETVVGPASRAVAQEALPEDEADLPPWLQDLSAAPEEPGEQEIPDWLMEELGVGEAEELDEELAQLGVDLSDVPEDADEAVAWLEQLTIAQEESPEMALDAIGEVDEDDLPEWLREEPAAIPEPEELEIPEWLQEAPAVEAPGELVAEVPDEALAADDLGDMPEDLDEAMAWLEQLAAREGAPLEELPTLVSAEDAEVELPEWLQEELAAAEVEPAVVAEMPMEEPDLPGWLDEAEEAPVAEVEAPTMVAADDEDLPEWLREIPEPVGAPEPEDVVLEAELVEAEEPELPEWLREAPEPIEEVAEEYPEPVDLEEPELPEWLRETPEPAQVAEVVRAEPTELEDEQLTEWMLEAPEAAEAEEELVAPELEEAEELELPEWLEEDALEVEEEEIAIAEDAEPEPGFEPELLVGISAFQEQLAADPSDHAARLALAQALAEEDEVGAALDQFGQLINSGQHLDKVLQGLERLVTARPDDTLARRLVGDVYMKQGDLDRALDAYRQALDLLS